MVSILTTDNLLNIIKLFVSATVVLKIYLHANETSVGTCAVKTYLEVVGSFGYYRIDPLHQVDP